MKTVPTRTLQPLVEERYESTIQDSSVTEMVDFEAKIARKEVSVEVHPVVAAMTEVIGVFIKEGHSMEEILQFMAAEDSIVGVEMWQLHCHALVMRTWPEWYEKDRNK
jgi:hypothetical protein